MANSTEPPSSLLERKQDHGDSTAIRVQIEAGYNAATAPGKKDSYSDQERKEILASLWDNPSSTDLEPLTDEEVRERLWRLTSRDNDWQSVKAFLRFDRLFLYSLLRTQHELIQLEEKASHGLIIDNEKLSTLLEQYTSLLKSYSELSLVKRRPRGERNFLSRVLATELHEPRYCYSSEPADFIDLRTDVARGTDDFLRKLLQQKLPHVFLDRTGKDLRNSDEEKSTQGNKSRVDNIIARHRANGRYISPSVDNFARVLFALFGGLFLLIPMIAMAYITSKKYLLITTVLFVLVFALSLGYFSKGSNQELVGATAAYAAVLVVFHSSPGSREESRYINVFGGDLSFFSQEDLRYSDVERDLHPKVAQPSGDEWQLPTVSTYTQLGTGPEQRLPQDVRHQQPITQQLALKKYVTSKVKLRNYIFAIDFPVLEKSPAFGALSYVCGEGRTERPIRVDGDLVCNFSGCPTPVMLRSVEDNLELSRLVYAPGIMLGEAMTVLQEKSRARGS